MFNYLASLYVFNIFSFENIKLKGWLYTALTRAKNELLIVNRKGYL